MLINTIHCIADTSCGSTASSNNIHYLQLISSRGLLLFTCLCSRQNYLVFFLLFILTNLFIRVYYPQKILHVCMCKDKKKTTTVTFPFQNSLSNYSTHLAWVTVADSSPGLKFCSCRLLTLSSGYEYILRATYQEFCTSIGQLVSMVMLLLFKSKPLKSRIHIQQLTPLSAQLLHLFH